MSGFVRGQHNRTLDAAGPIGCGRALPTLQGPFFKRIEVVAARTVVPLFCAAVAVFFQREISFPPRGPPLPRRPRECSNHGMQLSPAELASAASMTLGCAIWALAYLLIMQKARQDQAHGYPWIYTCLCFAYEFLSGFVIVPTAPGVVVPLQVWVMRLWWLIDIGLVTQLLLYGPALQPAGWRRRFFVPGTVVMIALAGAVEWSLIKLLHDRSGHILGFGMGVVGAFAWVGLSGVRPDGRGLSLPAAWLKLVGTLLISVPHAFMWPTIDPGQPVWPLRALYVAFTVGDLWYIARLSRSLRRSPLGAP